MRVSTEPVRADLPDVAAIVRPYGIGIDCHSRFISVCVLVQVDHEVLRYEREFSTAIAELTAARNWTRELLQFHNVEQAEFRYVLESTACYHFPVIHAWGGRPSIVNPLLAGPYRRKTDKLDARTMAYHGMSGLWPESFWAAENVIEFRVLVLRRRQLVRERSRVGHQINNTLLRWGHTIGATGKLTSGIGRAIVEDFCRGQLAAPHPNLGPLLLPETIRQEILDLYARYDEIDRQIREKEKTIVSRCREMDWETGDGALDGRAMLALLTTVPGVGTVTACVWLAEFVTPRRFTTAKQVAAYLGCDPSLKVSAGKVTSHVKRKGNSNIHAGLVQSAQMLISARREELGQWGYAISCKHAKGGWQKAVGAVARRIGLGLYWVQKTGTPFSYEKYRLTLRREFLLKEPVGNLPFSVRVHRLLETSGITDTHQLVDAIDNYLFKKRGFGAAARKEIVTWLETVRLKTRCRPEACSSPAESSEEVAASSNKTAEFASAKPIASSEDVISSTSTTGAKARPCRSALTSSKSPCTSARSKDVAGNRRRVCACSTPKRSPLPRRRDAGTRTAVAGGKHTLEITTDQKRPSNRPRHAF